MNIQNNHKKVLLVNPLNEFPIPILPLGLASVAAYLKENNIEVSVIDAWVEKIGFAELEDKVSKSDADIVGIYILSPNYDKAKKTIETCRMALKNSIIVAGGPHPSAIPQETLREIPQLDICVIGEGEITMLELVRAIQNNARLSVVDGLAYRRHGNINITKNREFIKNLDELPFPARDLFPLKKYKTNPPFGIKNPYFTLISSRGCPYQCAYCSKDVYKDKYRSRSPKKVCDEIEELIKKYGAKEIQFYDDDFTLDMKRAEEICDEIIERGIKIRWSCLTRVNLVNENLLKKMKEAGCWLITYGVESGNQKILNSINKGFTIEQVISSFKMTQGAGIATICDFIVGLPGETKETVQDTLNLIKKIEPNFIGGGILTIFPGSRLFKLIQNGKYPGKTRVLKRSENMPGIFFRGEFTVFEDNLTFEEASAEIKKIEREFYLRPQYIWQSLMSIRSLSGLHYYLNGGISVIKSLLK